MAHFTAMEWEIVAFMSARYDRWCRGDKIAAHLYPEDPPETARTVIRVMVHRIRQKIGVLGYEILSERGSNSRGYKLRPIRRDDETSTVSGARRGEDTTGVQAH